MKTCYNANGLRCMDPFQSIKEVKRYGYDGIELSFHPNHINPLSIDYKLLDQIKECLTENNLALASIASGCADLLSNTPYEPSLIYPDEAGRKMRMDMMKNCITIAQYLDAPILSFACGFKQEDVSDEQAYTYLVDEIKELLTISSSLILAIEPEPNMFIGTTEAAITLIKDINDERFKLNLDIGHVNCCEDNYLEKIETALPYTVHTHIEDIKDRVHYHLIPGDGDMDFSSIWDILKRNNYTHYLSIELYNHNDIWENALDRSIKYLHAMDK